MMLNHILAFIVVAGLLVYFVVELGWGGGGSWKDTFLKPKDILWIRWRRIGLYPPEPKEDDPKPVKPVSPKTPETVN